MIFFSLLIFHALILFWSKIMFFEPYMMSDTSKIMDLVYEITSKGVKMDIKKVSSCFFEKPHQAHNVETWF